VFVERVQRAGELTGVSALLVASAGRRAGCWVRDHEEEETIIRPLDLLPGQEYVALI
jgi:hypothetical protein